MAFGVQAIYSGGTVSLTDSTPYSLLSARGMAGAAVRRVTTAGPAQDGDSDFGYRLQPREIELEIGFRATTDAVLDGYRDTLVSVFKPLSSTPVSLRLTRDDGGVRQLDCYTVTGPKISLVKEHRPGHYHRATVRLVGPDVAYYDPIPGTATTVGPNNFAVNWWLAGGAIDAANVLMHGGTPAANEVWSYTGTITTAQNYTLAVRAGSVPAAGSAAYMFRGNNSLEPRFYRQTDTAGAYAGIPLFRFHADAIAGPGMAVGTQNYFFVGRPAPVNGVSYIAPGGNSFTDPAGSVVGTAMRWRTDSWPGTVQLYALYNIALDTSQRVALDSYMAGTSGTVAQAVAIPYVGNLPEYPVISIRGPISRPAITNTATGETLDFGTITIGAGTTYVIDTRYGVKTVKAGTVNKRSELTADSDLGTWHIAPSPVAQGGTNVIAVSGTALGTATTITVVYYNRYSSF